MTKGQIDRAAVLWHRGFGTQTISIDLGIDESKVWNKLSTIKMKAKEVAEEFRSHLKQKEFKALCKYQTSPTKCNEDYLAHASQMVEDFDNRGSRNGT